jgi:hypothetical protein
MEDSSPMDVFNLFFDNGIIAEIQSETNRFAKQQINIRKQEGPLKPKSVYAQWREVSTHETKIFLAIVIHMCLVKKPSLRDYWTMQPIFHTNYTTKIGMSREQFLAILTVLHVNNNEDSISRGQPGYDPMHKVQPILNALTARFRNVYTPEENLTIDEAICAF